MKHTIKNYATALAELILDSKSNKKEIANRFLDLLKKNNDTGKAKKIIALAEIYYLAKKGNKSIVLETARKTEAKNTLRSLYKEGDIVKEKINPEIIAGIKIIINNEKQLDFSLSKKLNDIFR